MLYFTLKLKVLTCFHSHEYFLHIHIVLSYPEIFVHQTNSVALIAAQLSTIALLVRFATHRVSQVKVARSLHGRVSTFVVHTQPFGMEGCDIRISSYDATPTARQCTEGINIRKHSYAPKRRGAAHTYTHTHSGYAADSQTSVWVELSGSPQMAMLTTTGSMLIGPIVIRAGRVNVSAARPSCFEVA